MQSNLKKLYGMQRNIPLKNAVEKISPLFSANLKIYSRLCNYPA